jgi:hypothetical protein
VDRIPARLIELMFQGENKSRGTEKQESQNTLNK